MEMVKNVELNSSEINIVVSGLLKSLAEPILNELRTTIDKHMEQALPELIKIKQMKQKICLTTDEVETLFSIPKGTLKVDRCNGKGPAYIKDGRRVLYMQEELIKYFKDRFIKTIED